MGLVAGALADRVVPRSMILLMEAGQMLLAFALENEGYEAYTKGGASE